MIQRGISLLAVVCLSACSGGGSSGGSGGSGASGGSGGGTGGAPSGGGSGGSSGSAGAATGGSAGTASGGAGGGTNCLASDAMTWNGTDYHEQVSSSDPSVCDPQIMAVAYSDFVSTGSPGLNLLLHYDWDASAKVFGSYVTIDLFGQTPGDYAAQLTGPCSVVWHQPSGNCSVGSGSLTLTSYGGIGGTAEGTFSFGDFSGAGGAACPTGTIDGSFSMSVIDGDQLGP